MIKQFNEVPVRDSGVIYNGSWEQIKMLHQQNPQLAGELAISLFELTLTGQVSTDDFMIQVLLKNQEKIVEKDKEKYNRKQKSAQSKKLDRLTEIANLHNQGYKQKDIAAKLGKAASTISEDMTTIRADYPELLKENFGKFGKFEGVNDNVNVNVNLNANANDNALSAKEEGVVRHIDSFTSGVELQAFKAAGGIVIWDEEDK